MIDLFEFSNLDDNDKIFHAYKNLNINKSPSFYLILLGLTGNLKITHTFSDTTFEQVINYLDNTPIVVDFADEKDHKIILSDDLKAEISNLIPVLRQKAKSNLEILPKYISDSFSLDDLNNVLGNKNLINTNKGFFDPLNNEFSNFHYHTSKQNHTVAFLHIYRILEYVSYTFPVMYAASTKDFAKSFDSLKALFSGDKDQGELKVFKYFISNVLSVEKDYKRLNIDIYITSELSDYNSRIYQTLINICDSNISDAAYNVENSKLAVKFSEFSSFIITIRNRFFHLKNSQGTNNIHSLDIVDSDFFFSLLNRKCVYFLSLITFVIVKKTYFQK